MQTEAVAASRAVLRTCMVKQKGDLLLSYGQRRFVILTTEANPSVAPVHSRMPLILEKKEAEGWIFEEGRTAEFLKKTPVMLEKKLEYEQLTLF